ncbi:putative aspartic-type endopeptidase CTSD [Yarrowia sp. C11]|nr:putative aspartic-type endopeptidase CTSD [Yarrowia sp. E02]KAG5369087.1 putative aspartic-type endopeptidase CTSD [Yarrowia sp. C11]
MKFTTTTLLALSTLASAFRPFTGHAEIAKAARANVPSLGEPQVEDLPKSPLAAPGSIQNKASSSGSLASSSVDCKHFVPVEQDGGDVSYYVNTQLGSSQAEYRMVLDTGSYYMWVYSENCTSTACMKRNRFGVDNSTTIKPTDHTYSISYTSGDIDGDIVVDNMTLGATTSRTQFGTANQADPSFASFAIDGIMGLSAVDKSEDNFPSLISVLKDQGQIDQRVFGVALGRSADKTEGSLVLGDYDHAAVDGDISWADVQSGTALWKVAVDGAYVGGNKVDFGASRNAIVDTGTTLLVMPPDDAMKFHGYIPNSQTDGKNYALPCDSTVSIEIEVAGAKWAISPKDYIGFKYTDNSGLCASNIQGLKTGNDGLQWILGAVFMKNVYTVFDMDKKQVGFAKKKETDVNSKCGDFVKQYQSEHKEAAKAATTSASSSSEASSSTAESSSSASSTETSSESSSTNSSDSSSSTENSSKASSTSEHSSSSASPSSTKAIPSASGLIANESSYNTTLSSSATSGSSSGSSAASTAEATSASSSDSSSADSASAASTPSANENGGSSLLVSLPLALLPFILLCM